jgi:hypothetical protein
LSFVIIEIYNPFSHYVISGEEDENVGVGAIERKNRCRR